MGYKPMIAHTISVQIEPTVADLDVTRRHPDRQPTGELDHVDPIVVDLQERMMGLDCRIVDRDPARSTSTHQMPAGRQLDTLPCIRARRHRYLHNPMRVVTRPNRKPVHVRGLLPTDA